MAQIKAQHFDTDGNLVHEEYYAEGEYEAVIEEERQAKIKGQKAVIDAHRRIAFADIHTGSDGMFAKAAALRAQGLDDANAIAKAVKRRQEIIDSLPYQAEHSALIEEVTNKEE